ncbi:hypothetical protein [Mesorhizobium silamurunense]|nr:hypothetical protein [Mesorhizobium silamurunense]
MKIPLPFEPAIYRRAASSESAQITGRTAGKFVAKDSSCVEIALRTTV